MVEKVTLEALSIASLSAQIAAMAHETRARITATENGRPWAVVELYPLTDTRRTVFPLGPGGWMGDTRKRGESGVMFSSGPDALHALNLVINRARVMHKKYSA